MDFDTLLSLASKNQQDKLGIRRPAAISTSLPAPKRLERKQVDSSAIRRLLDDKRVRSAEEAAVARNPPAAAAAAAAGGTSLRERSLPSTTATEAVTTGSTVGLSSSSGGRQNSLSSHHDRQSRVAGSGSGSRATAAADGLLVKEGSVSHGGSSSSGHGSVPVVKAKLPGAAATGAATGRADRQAGSSKAQPAVSASAAGGRAAADSTQSHAQPKGSAAKDSAAAVKAKATLPPKPLNYAELMALAAAKAVDPAAAAAHADRLSKPPELVHREQKSGARPSVPSGPAKGPVSAATKATAQSQRPVDDGNCTAAPQQRHRRKRRSKLPPELEDLLGIRDPGRSRTDQGVNGGRPGDPAGSAAKVKDPKAAKVAADGKSKKPEAAGPRTARQHKTGPTQAAAAAEEQQPPRPCGVSKARLAVAVMQKKKDAAAAVAALASAAASRSPGRLPQERPPQANEQAARLQSETVASHTSGRGPAAQPTSRSQQLPSGSAAAAARAPAVAGKLTAPRNDAANLSVWDRIYNKTVAASKPKESKKRHVLESDDDEYDEEMDDFIDDGDSYAPGGDISAEIKKIFGYDRSKFRDDDDDDINMEARFADVMKEEARSARLGRLEDLEDMRKEEEYKKAKKRKKLE